MDNPTVVIRGDSQPGINSKSFDAPDTNRDLGRGSGEFVDLGKGLVIGRAVLQPGWRWSEDVGPAVGTRSCAIHHIQLVVSGRLGVQLDGREEQVFGPSWVIDLPPGHDAWVVGDEPLVIVDMSGNSADFGQPAREARTVVTMLMTDIVNSTPIAAAMGDDAWKQRLGEHNRIVRRQVERFGGREIDTTGDGFLAAFASAEAALRCALAIRDALADAGLEIRAGVHSGEVDIVEGGDLRGIAVHETARIMASAPAGMVYASGIARALAGNSRIPLVSVGPHALKGFDEPVELFRVESNGDALSE